MISKLRRVAERHWDAYDPSNATESDPYLVAAVRRLSAGHSLDAVAEYIVEAEIDCLGIDTGSGIRERALQFASALKSCL